MSGETRNLGERVAVAEGGKCIKSCFVFIVALLPGFSVKFG